MVKWLGSQAVFPGSSANPVGLFVLALLIAQPLFRLEDLSLPRQSSQRFVKLFRWDIAQHHHIGAQSQHSPFLTTGPDNDQAADG